MAQAEDQSITISHPRNRIKLASNLQRLELMFMTKVQINQLNGKAIFSFNAMKRTAYCLINQIDFEERNS